MPTHNDLIYALNKCMSNRILFSKHLMLILLKHGKLNDRVRVSAEVALQLCLCMEMLQALIQASARALIFVLSTFRSERGHAGG
jgi:hypothetical protein